MGWIIVIPAEIPAAEVVDEAVLVVVYAIACNFAGVDENVGRQIRVVVVEA